LVIVAVVAVTLAVITAVAIGAILAAAAAFGLRFRLRVGGARGDGEEANGGGGNAGFQVHRCLLDCAAYRGLPPATLQGRFTHYKQRFVSWFDRHQGNRCQPAAYLLLRMTCKKSWSTLIVPCGCFAVARFGFAFREVLDVRLQL
jgi:hypothetical protein